MTRFDRRKRLAELEGSPIDDEPEHLKPRPPQWLIDRVLEACQGQPDAMLADWLLSRQVYPDDIAAWRHPSVPSADWADPGKVLRSVRAIVTDPPHPQATFLLAMLHSLVSRHAPQNADLVPLIPPGVGAAEPAMPEPATAPPTIAARLLSEAELQLAYKNLSIPSPRTIQVPE